MIWATNSLLQFPWSFCWTLAATEGDVRSAVVAGDMTISSSRAIIEDMKIVIKNPVQNFVTTRGWRLEAGVDLTAENVYLESPG